MRLFLQHTLVFEDFRAVKNVQDLLQHALQEIPAFSTVQRHMQECLLTHRHWKKSEPPENIPPKHPKVLQGTREVTRVVLSLLFQGGSRLLALKHIWGAALPLQERRMESSPAGQKAKSGLLLWDDMLLYMPIWIRLLWNVRKCVVSGRHRRALCSLWLQGVQRFPVTAFHLNLTLSNRARQFMFTLQCPQHPQRAQRDLNI